MSRTDPAQVERDQGLRRARRLTVATAALATALAGATAGVAAMTLPGRSTSTAQNPGSPAGNPGDQGVGAQDQQGQQDGLNVPDQAPQPGAGQGPRVITGGS